MFFPVHESCNTLEGSEVRFRISTAPSTGSTESSGWLGASCAMPASANDVRAREETTSGAVVVLAKGDVTDRTGDDDL